MFRTFTIPVKILLKGKQKKNMYQDFASILELHSTGQISVHHNFTCHFFTFCTNKKFGIYIFSAKSNHSNMPYRMKRFKNSVVFTNADILKT